jgi:protein tyrosine/serine phosphatase
MWSPDVWRYSIRTAAVETPKKERSLPSRFNPLHSVCLVLLLVAPICAQGPKPRFYRVDENVYRGKQPTKEDIPKLSAMGVKTVLDLRERFERKLWERGAVEAAGMQYIRIGLPGTLEPTDRAIDKILAILEDPAHGPVFIHCRRGADRTGLVIACYRIVHDHWTNAQALKEAREQGLSPFEILMRRYIEHYRRPVSAAR